MQVPIFSTYQVLLKALFLPDALPPYFFPKFSPIPAYPLAPYALNQYLSYEPAPDLAPKNGRSVLHWSEETQSYGLAFPGPDVGVMHRTQRMRWVLFKYLHRFVGALCSKWAPIWSQCSERSEARDAMQC